MLASLMTMLRSDALLSNDTSKTPQHLEADTERAMMAAMALTQDTMAEVQETTVFPAAHEIRVSASMLAMITNAVMVAPQTLAGGPFCAISIRVFTK